MSERQLQGVQGEAVEPEALAEEAVVLPLAVAHVADQRMADVLEVAADLVAAAGPRPGLDQGVAFEDCEAAEPGHRRHPRAVDVAGDRMIDHPRLRRDAAHQGEIALLHRARLEPLLHPAGGRGIEGEEQDAAGRAVEPVDRVDAPAGPVADELKREDPILGRPPVDGEARGLADGQKEPILVKDGQVQGGHHSGHGFAGAYRNRARTRLECRQMTHFKSDASTVGLSGTGRLRAIPRGKSSPASIPTLTLLYHPDLRRVGERALLSELTLGREARLGRHEPEFSTPESAMGEPLNDRHISRQPLQLRPAPQGGIVLAAGESRTRVVVDGVLLAGELAIPAAELVRGVVLELADRVVLLLHVLDHLTAPAAKRFGLEGDSSGIARVRDEIAGVADLEVGVLLRGETGTGKELAARALHDASRRHNGPFIAVNLGAIPPTLVASELFGAARGAYTGSVQQQEGYFRRAHGGTLLLDEIGEATPEVQVMLLRTLETGEVHPVGTQSPQRVDVRVLAATDADLEARAAAGEFRAPLLHRLAGYEIWLPPLRERRDDVGRLLIHFLRRELAPLGEASAWIPAPPAHPSGCRRASSPGSPATTGRATSASSATWPARSPSAAAGSHGRRSAPPSSGCCAGRRRRPGR